MHMSVRFLSRDVGKRNGPKARKKEVAYIRIHEVPMWVAYKLSPLTDRSSFLSVYQELIVGTSPICSVFFFFFLFCFQLFF